MENTETSKSDQNSNFFSSNKGNLFSKFKNERAFGFANKNFPTNKLIASLFVVLLLLGLFYWIKALSSGAGGSSSAIINDKKVKVEDAKATKKLNKDFAFPLRDEKGDEVSKIKYVIESAELRDEIIVKGQRATALEGRDFLVINLKITNDFKKSVALNTRDYIRLSANSNDKELLAPEIHNDPVEIQAQSTKYTRLAFAINESDKNLKLRIGEIDKENKTVVDLKF